MALAPIVADRILSSGLSPSSLEEGKPDGLTAGDQSNPALRKHTVCYYVSHLDWCLVLSTRLI